MSLHLSHLVRDGGWLCARCGARPQEPEWHLACTAPDTRPCDTEAPAPDVDWFALARDAG